MSRRNSKDLMNEKTNASSAASIKPEIEERSRANSTVNGLMGGQQTPPSMPLITFEIDVGGNDDVIRKWPSFLRLENGKALIQATVRQDSFDLEAQRPSASNGRTR